MLVATPEGRAKALEFIGRRGGSPKCLRRAVPNLTFGLAFARPRTQHYAFVNVSDVYGCRFRLENDRGSDVAVLRLAQSVSP